MKYKFIISIVIKSLMENKLRSILTIITNFIGMTAILIVIITSSSLNHKVETEVKGTDEITFTIFSKDFNETASKFNFTENDLEMVKKNVTSIKEIKYAEQMTIGENTFEVANPVVVSGTNFDNNIGNVLIYNNIDQFATGETDAQGLKYDIGDYIVKDNIRYYIIGITQNLTGFALPATFYIPSYLESEFKTKVDNTLLVTFYDSYDKKTESENLKTTLSQDISVDEEILIFDEKATVRSVINSITIFFVGLGSISLVVSLVAIINMLFVSVNERKSQIAILRALGMQKLDIALMFIFESLLIIISSTLLATMFASLVASLILNYAQVSLFISLGWIVFTVIFVIILAVIAALLPALNSSKTNISIILRMI